MQFFLRAFSLWLVVGDFCMPAMCLIIFLFLTELPLDKSRNLMTQENRVVEAGFILATAMDTGKNEPPLVGILLVQECDFAVSLFPTSLPLAMNTSPAMSNTSAAMTVATYLTKL